jgi:hypothetical protein
MSLGNQDLPLVDDAYWLGRGRDAVTAVPAQIREAAKTLMGAVTWFWTAFTGVAFVGTALTHKHLPISVAVLSATPPILLVVAYLAAARCLMPDIRAVNANAPELIEERIAEGVKHKLRQLWIACGLTAVAALAAGGAILALALS